MKIGTKSVLLGAHCFFLHPFFVAWAWWKLYGFPLDPRLWAAFFLHDIGYWGKPNMDGPEGEEHPTVGAKVMHRLFDHVGTIELPGYVIKTFEGVIVERAEPRTVSVETFEWHDFCLLHSRYFAKKLGRPFSKLCVADKLAFALTPPWLYLPMVNLTGEIHEYMGKARLAAAVSENLNDEERRALLAGDQKAWYEGVKAYMLRWVEQHKDGREDQWTKARTALA